MDHGASSHKRSGRGRGSPPRGDAGSGLWAAGGLGGPWEGDEDKLIKTLGRFEVGSDGFRCSFPSMEWVGIHP